MNTTLTYKGRKIQNRATNILGPVIALPLVALTLLATPFVLLLGVVVLIIGALKPFVVIAGVIVTIVGLVSLFSGHGWVALIVGLAMLLLAKMTKVTFTR